MTSNKTVHYSDLVAGKIYRFISEYREGVYATDGDGHRISGPHKSIEFFLLSPELTLEFNGFLVGHAIKILVGEEIQSLVVCTSYRDNGEFLIGGTFWEVQDEK
jgi:hypothetical protein